MFAQQRRQSKLPSLGKGIGNQSLVVSPRWENPEGLDRSLIHGASLLHVSPSFLCTEIDD